MTTEEKAKAYDEALERAKEIKSKILSSHLSTESCKAVSEYIDTIIPELRESENERMINKLISLFKWDGDTRFTKEECDGAIAWLEKQKESLHIQETCKENADSFTDEDERVRAVILKLVLGMRDEIFTTADKLVTKPKVLDWLKKQKKQPKEELVYRLNGLMQDYIKEGKDDEEKEHRLKCYQLFWDALEDTNFLEKKEQKPHLELKAGKWYICHRAYCARADHLTVKEGERFMCEKDGIVKGFVIKEPEKYFKECSAPEPVEKDQKPAEWSEEDDKIASTILNLLCSQVTYVTGQGTTSGKQYPTYAKERDWFEKRFKSLRPQSHWTREDEHQAEVAIAFLKDYADKGYENAVCCIDWIKSKLNGNTGK